MYDRAKNHFATDGQDRSGYCGEGREPLALGGHQLRGAGDAAAGCAGERALYASPADGPFGKLDLRAAVRRLRHPAAAECFAPAKTCRREPGEPAFPAAVDGVDRRHARERGFVRGAVLHGLPNTDGTGSDGHKVNPGDSRLCLLTPWPCRRKAHRLTGAPVKASGASVEPVSAGTLAACRAAVG